MTQSKSSSVLWWGGVRAVMLGMLLSLLWGRAYGMAIGQAPLSLVESQIASTCGNPNGTIILAGSGGTAPYQYSIDGGVTYHSSGTFSGLVGGAYTVSVMDLAGAVVSQGMILGNLAGPTVTVMPIAATCANNDGELDVNVSFGDPPYQIAVNGGPPSTGNLFGGLPSGSQAVTVVDNNGCLVTQTVNIPLINNLSLAMGPGATICQGTSTMLTLTTNATAFSWSPATGLDNPASAQPNASPGTTTTYTVSAALGVCVMTGPETITVLPAPIAVATGSDTICYGQSVQLQGSGGVSYQWSPATYLSSTTIPDPVVQTPQKSLTYTLNVTDANGCTSIEPGVVMVEVTTPVVFAGNDTAVLIGQTVPLDAVDIDHSGFTNFQWSPLLGLDNPSIQDPVATITGDITYMVTATTPTGCSATASIKIVAVTASDMVVPNAFTPNGDGHNDILRVHLIGIKDFKYFRVFNRWGQEVFATTNEGIGWDGTVRGQAQPLGSYVWVALGLDLSGRAVERQGTVILIR